MSYQAMLVHADQAPSAAARMELAIRLAHACRAHMTGLACTGVSRYAELEHVGSPGPLIEAELQRWRQHAQASLATLAALARDRAEPAPNLLLLEDDAEDGDAAAPFNDLLILGQTDPHYHAPGVIRDLPQYLLLHGGRPLLLVPHANGSDCSAPFHHPLLAWDGSRQATRAISDALPLLKLANTVTLLMLNPEQQRGRAPAEPGTDMAVFLARHGVRVNVMREHTSVDTGSALLCVATELQCDLLVMGGYGHRRAREIVLGGATRTVLANMNLPVLIAH
jgi:nucleotide-binding universal stress UspA family protein